MTPKSKCGMERKMRRDSTAMLSRADPESFPESSGQSRSAFTILVRTARVAVVSGRLPETPHRRETLFNASIVQAFDACSTSQTTSRPSRSGYPGLVRLVHIGRRNIGRRWNTSSLDAWLSAAGFLISSFVVMLRRRRPSRVEIDATQRTGPRDID